MQIKVCSEPAHRNAGPGNAQKSDGKFDAPPTACRDWIKRDSAAETDVRFVPKAGITAAFTNVCFVP
jgi:hypothetical protein